VASGTVENVVIALADTEQSHTLPANTKSFLVQARGTGKVQMSFTALTTGTEFYTIWSGAFYSKDNINAASTTIYFRSPIAGLVVEFISWA
jgi:hypothetical protein